ncbi:hypothetical protein BGZ76_007976 [Entomortierella beljakovae]|nr:hypothetical protein BGZ76_007976 [Entomortierella beljakovae]
MSSKIKKRSYRKKELTPEEPTDSTTESGDSSSKNEEEPEGLTLEELVELRKFRQRPSGIATSDLLSGDTTGKKKKKDKDVALDPFNLDDIKKREGEETKSTGILNSFTKQTNTLDVDKHMMRYIEDEMKKRRGESSTAEEDADENSRNRGNSDIEILDGLGIKRNAPKPEQEGNVQLSTTMLTAIPEVDLGMDAKLKNIEETEKAKRKLLEARATSQVSSDRFSRPAYVPSDRERISHHKQNRRTNNNNNNNNNNNSHSGDGGNHRFQNYNDKGHGRDMATDDMVMERFKKRMRK